MSMEATYNANIR